MPDARHPSAPAGPARDWSDAFNALPLEAPPADAWPSIATALEARREGRRLRVPAWLGLAAAAAIVAVVAWPRAEAPVTAPPDVGATQVATTRAATTQPAEATQVATPQGATTGPAEAMQVATRQSAAATHHPTPTPTPSTPSTSRQLETLQHESARLEALLAVARDDRTGSAGTVLLADAFDAQVAGIDAALSDPAIDLDEREQLWQARVDALQQAAGFFGTQRLMAAQGSADTWLVSVD